jgi:hypothetical protein
MSRTFRANIEGNKKRNKGKRNKHHEVKATKDIEEYSNYIEDRYNEDFTEMIDLEQDIFKK